MHITKMEGLGNDYFYFFGEVPGNVKELAVRLSDRHRGIGSDGLIYISDSDCADFRMRIFNADGSEAKMCGNGIRCVGKYVYEKHLTRKEELAIETNSGIRTLKLSVHDGIVTSVLADMGIGSVTKTVPVTWQGKTYTAVCADVGNPHMVLFVTEEELSLVHTLGPVLEHHAAFPDGVNVEFVSVTSPASLRMRVWERGSGITMACGTGACASAAAAVHAGFCQAGAPAALKLDGGVLEITVEEDGRIFMRGPACFAFEGEVEMGERQ